MLVFKYNDGQERLRCVDTINSNALALIYILNNIYPIKNSERDIKLYELEDFHVLWRGKKIN